MYDNIIFLLNKLLTIGLDDRTSEEHFKISIKEIRITKKRRTKYQLFQ